MPIEIICKYCNKPFFVKPSKANRSKFCCKECANNGRKQKSIEKIAGKKFVRLTAIEKQGQYWFCQCDCGNEHLVKQKHLLSGNVTSCGCYRREIGKKMVKKNGLCDTIKIKPDTRFGQWIVIKFDETRNKYSHHICQCDCGTIRSVMSRNLLKGLSRSCGCYHKKVSAKQAKKNFTKHGLSKETWYLNYLQQQRRESDSNWTTEMAQLLLSIQDTCVICQSRDNLEVDHVIPFSKGGKLEPGNAIILCKTCNLKKYNHSLNDLPIGWRQLIETAANQFLQIWKLQTTDTH